MRRVQHVRCPERRAGPDAGDRDHQRAGWAGSSLGSLRRQKGVYGWTGKHAQSHPYPHLHTQRWLVCYARHTDGDGISVKFDDVNGFEGVSFQFSDGTDDAYYFRSDADKGMTGTIDTNGLVSNGAVPEIKFNLAGIEVPQSV